MLDYPGRKQPHLGKRSSRVVCSLGLICYLLFSMLSVEVGGVPTRKRRNTDDITETSSMDIATTSQTELSLEEYANSGKIHNVERIKKMMESLDDIVLQRFFRAALAGLDEEDEGDSGSEDDDSQIPPPSTSEDDEEPKASTSQSSTAVADHSAPILQDSELPNDLKHDKSTPRRVSRSLAARPQSIRAELWPHHRRRRKGCPPVKDKVQFLCPSKNHHLYDVCISKEQLCDHVNDCPNNEDEDEKFCLFFKPLDHELKTVVHAVLLLVDNSFTKDKLKVEL